jgi:DNA-binding NarL/FixJ family response regulator
VTIRVLVADDERLVRAGFRMILASEPGLEVVAEAADGIELVEAVERHEPDVVLMDIRMPRRDGLAATRDLRDRGARARVIVLTTFDLDEYVYEALRAGASAFLLKDAPDERLISAIRVVADGGSLFDAAATRRLVARFARGLPAVGGPRLLDGLTPREREILVLVSQGCSNREIADALVISENTAKTHVAHVLDKLGVRDRVQAVVLAYEAGVLPPGVEGRTGPHTP